MSDKYCPAGKCECDGYTIDPEDGKPFCNILFCGMDDFEVCPWPSRQMPKQISGRSQALADARAAVTAYWNEAYPGGVLELTKFIAAISALEVKP